MSERWGPMWALARAEEHSVWGGLCLPSTTPSESVEKLRVIGYVDDAGFLTLSGEARRQSLLAREEAGW